VAELQKRVSQLEALRILGATDGVPAARKALEEAKALGYRPLIGEALLALGGLEEAAAEPDSRSQVVEAASVALSARDDATAARAFTRLVRFDNYGRHFADARAWAAMASACLERMGGDDSLELARLIELARVVRNEGNFAEAAERTREVLARSTKLDGAQSGRAAGAHHDLATVLRQLGQLDEAMREEREALRIVLRLNGDRHPRTHLIRASIGILATQKGDLAEGERELRGVLALGQELFGAEHPNVGDDLVNLADNLRDQGRLGEGLELVERATGIYRRKLGADHSRVAIAEASWGRLLLSAGQAAKAVPLLEHALKLSEPAGDPPALAEIELALAEALWGAGTDRDRARSLGASARQIFASLATRSPQKPNLDRLSNADHALERMR
jgi:tetratricopeptide (TPR) repeat protein